MTGDEDDEIIDRIHATCQAMPKTCESTAKGLAALARLHEVTDKSLALPQL